jgi:hypothetical protein
MENLTSIPDAATRSTLQAFSAYDLPSVEALLKYFHVAAGFPVKDTWLRAIKNKTMGLGRGSPTKMRENTARQRMKPSRAT